VPHHDATQSNGLPRSQDSDKMLLKYPEEPLIGIDENAAFVVHDGLAYVVSGDGVAKCVIKRAVKGADGQPIIEEKALLDNDKRIELSNLLSSSSDLSEL
jgi:hypothetical protein